MNKDAGCIAVVGAGIMGHGIAQAFAQKGYPINLYDVESGVLDDALESIRSNLCTFVEFGVTDEASIEETIKSIHPFTRLNDAVRDADFVVEAAPEDIELKRDIFNQMDAYTHDHAILASNTSMLSISEFGSGTTKQDKLIITHWFNPPHIVPTVEVVMGKETSKETFSVTFDLLKKIGKQPVKVLKEIPGFLINRIQTAMFREVLSLLEQGMASPEDLDLAVKGSFGFRLGVIGILETMDLAGLDLMAKGTGYLYPYLDKSNKPHSVLMEKVNQNHLGAKTGEGFFSYPSDPAQKDGTSPIKERDKKLLAVLKAVASVKL